MNKRPLSEKERQILGLLAYAKEHYPKLKPLLNFQLHHVKTKYAGIIAIAIAACEILTLVLG